MSGLRISVVIPCRDEAAVIERLLLQLQAARRAGHEVILVDGGSADDSGARARPLVDRLVLSAPGRAVQMNAGADVAGGDLLWFLHADSLPPVSCHEALQAVFEDPCAVWGRCDIQLDGVRPVFRLVERMINLRSRLSGIATGDQGLFMRRAAFQAVGGFPALPLMEDVAISRLLKKQGKPLAPGFPLVTSSRRWERHGVARTILLMWWLRLAFFLGVPAERLSRLYPKCSSPAPGS